MIEGAFEQPLPDEPQSIEEPRGKPNPDWATEGPSGQIELELDKGRADDGLLFLRLAVGVRVLFDGQLEWT
ncbi:MAG: hypothetical protein K2Y51_03585 [Gammaproteobacteria bacterium]|nr:hypothetical protein [Gammaproteobacteria bacterium]